MSIEDYKLEKQIGSDSFGEVFRGTEVKTGMKVAIKRIIKKI
jgi:serine/threonine protein kinase